MVSNTGIWAFCGTLLGSSSTLWDSKPKWNGDEDPELFGTSGSEPKWNGDEVSGAGLFLGLSGSELNWNGDEVSGAGLFLGLSGSELLNWNGDAVSGSGLFLGTSGSELNWNGDGSDAMSGRLLNSDVLIGSNTGTLVTSGFLVTSFSNFSGSNTEN